MPKAKTKNMRIGKIVKRASHRDASKKKIKDIKDSPAFKVKKSKRIT